MHICVISPMAITDTTSWGGLHTHTEMLSKLLVKQGIKVTLITIDFLSKPPETIIDGIRVVFMSGITSRVVDNNWIEKVRDIVIKTHREEQIDFIFSEGYSAYGLQNESTFRNVPIFAFAHNFSLTHFYNNWKEVYSILSLATYLLKTIPKLFFRMFRYEIPFYRNCRCVISGSKLNAGYLQQIYRVPGDKIQVIHNWVDTKMFTPNRTFRQEHRKQLGVSDEITVFLLVGSVWRPKGFHVAIKSFSKVVLSIPNALLLIVGGGPDVKYLHQLVDQNLHIKDKVQFGGHWNHSELAYIYNSADIFLMPSLLSEVLPYSLLEAMSTGLPAIATKIGGNIELVGNAGVFVPPGDPESLTETMIVLAKSPEARKLLSEAARNRMLEHFSEEVANRKISALINEAVHGK